MAVTYSTLFQRLGKLFGMAQTIRTHQANLRTEYADVISTYSDADMYMVGNLTRDIETRINDSERILRLIRDDAESTLIEMVDDDLVASYGGGLEHRNKNTALRELIRQMDANSSSVDGTTITIGTITAGGSNVGNGKMLLSALASQTFAPTVVDYPSVKTELIRARCVNDANTNRIAERAEQFEITGQRAEQCRHMQMIHQKAHYQRDHNQAECWNYHRRRCCQCFARHSREYRHNKYQGKKREYPEKQLACFSHHGFRNGGYQFSAITH